MSHTYILKLIKFFWGLLLLVIWVLLPVAANAQKDSAMRTMDFYVDAAVKNSPLLKDYGNQVMANRLDSLAIRAQNRPQVNGIVSALYAPSFGAESHPLGYENAITNGGNYAAQVSATQNIFNRNLLAPQYQTVVIQGQTLGNTSKLSEHDIRHNVITQYLAAWLDWKLLESNRETLRLLKEEGSMLKPLVNAGIIKQTAYLSFDMEYQNGELNLLQLQIQYKLDLMALNILCGVQDTSSAIKLAAPALTPNLVLYNYYNSPAAMQYKIDSMRISNQKMLVDIRYKPKLAWSADAGFLSSTPDFYMHPGFSLGVGLVVPIFDGYQKKIDYDRLSFQERSRQTYLSYYHNQYNAQFNMLSNQLRASNELAKKIEAQLKSSENLIKMSRIELNSGDISVTDFILILRNNIDLKNSLNQSQLKISQIINDMNYYNWQ